MPIYKVEKYLSKCIDSILNQTYRNLEVILVDDESPDHCPTICDEYAEKDARVKVIHQKNKGLSGARNSGIEVAKGDFIAFVDSDDFIHEKMYEILYKHIVDYDSDMSVCELQYVYEEEQPANDEIKYDEECISVYSGREALGNLYNDKAVTTVVAWNKLYKRKLFESLRYPIGKTHEDEFLIHRLLTNSESIVYSNARLYFYLQRNSSIMGKGYNLKRLDHVEALLDRMIYFKTSGFDAVYLLAHKHYLEALLNNYFSVKRFYPGEKKIARQLKHTFSAVFNEQLEGAFCTDEKIYYRVFCYSPLLYRFIAACRRRLGE